MTMMDDWETKHKSDLNLNDVSTPTLLSSYLNRGDALSDVATVKSTIYNFPLDLVKSGIESLDKEQISEFKQAFSNFDRDGDGTIHTKELQTAIRNLGQNPTDEEIQEMINETDIDGNGTVDFFEFLNMMVKMLNQADQDEDNKAAFHVFDEYSIGAIDADEFEDVLTTVDDTLTRQEAKEIMMKAGNIPDRKITYEQFKELMSW